MRNKFKQYSALDLCMKITKPNAAFVLRSALVLVEHFLGKEVQQKNDLEKILLKVCPLAKYLEAVAWAG